VNPDIAMATTLRSAGPLNVPAKVKIKQTKKTMNAQIEMKKALRGDANTARWL